MSSPPPPVFIKRTKSKPAQRAREPSPANDDPSGEAAENSPSTLASKLKNKIKRTKPKSRLSFGGDDDEEGDTELFKVKKSNFSRKVTLGTHPAVVTPSLDQATISPDTPKYDAAYLKELKASTPSARPPAPSNVLDSDISVDLVDTAVSSMGMDMEIDETAFIPSESSIKTAKEKRERLRKTQASGEDDFISLSVAKRDEGPQGPHPESRLMREEDELGEGDDEFAEYTSAQERIALGKKSRKVEATQKRDAMKELIADAEEEDEETAEWEQEQLRRGGHRTPEPSSTAKVKQVYKAAPIPPATQVPTLGPAISRLSEQLSRLTTSHAQNSSTLSSLAQERLEVDNRETEMRDMVEKAEEKRAWFGDFREWTESVAGFLDEKYPLLEKLEEEHLSLFKERRDMIAKRRGQDDEDDLRTFLGLQTSTISDDSEPKLDEFGRSIPVDPASELRERRLERLDRRKRRSSRQTAVVAEEEGYSTDSSLAPTDLAAYGEAVQSIAASSKEVLADVKAAEFRDPAKGRWAVWREKYADSYVGAWGGLGVVSVWEFWVRLECVNWDCIENPRSLHSFKWYQGLYEYSRPGNEGAAEERSLGPDGDLVASMVSTAIIPLICKQIEGGALDVYSRKNVARMIDLAEEVEAGIGEDNAKYQNLLKSVLSLFQTAIASTESSINKHLNGDRPLPAFDPEAIPARTRYLNRRVKLLRNLLRWRKYAGGRLGLNALVSHLVEGCIVPVAETGWDVGGSDISRTVAKLLPAELVPVALRSIQQS